MSDMSAGRPGGWAAAGPAGGDTAYRMQTLRFQPVEMSLDESVSLATLFNLWLRAAVISVCVWFVFLLMWLINTTTPEQKRGIADYFAPQSIAQTLSGSGGVLGGKVMGRESARVFGTLRCRIAASDHGDGICLKQFESPLRVQQKGGSVVSRSCCG